LKFACDKCQTRYSIADERVRGRVLKIKCKSCAHVITVREERSADVAVAVAAAGGARRATVDNAIEESFGRPGINDSQADEEHTMISSGPVDLAALGFGAAEPASPASPANKDDWYVSFDGEQEGPYALDKAQARVKAEQGSGREAHCWRPGYLVWLTVEEVPELAQKKAKAPPPMPAMPKRPATQLKSVPESDSKPHPKVEPKPVDGLAPKPALPSMPVPRTSVPGVPPVPSVQSVAPARPATPFATAAPTPVAKVAQVAEAATAPEKVKMVAPAVPMADRVDTGPTALPPAPGRNDDLLISEPSGLFNLSHVAAMHGTQKAAAVAARNAPAAPMPTGPTPQPETAAAAAVAAFALPEPPPNANPAPVVVMTGPAPRSLSPVVKWAAVIGVLLSLGLGGALIYVLMNRTQPLALAPVPKPVDPARTIDNTPIAIGDGVVPKAAVPAAATGPVAQPKRPSQPRATGTAPINPGSKLSESQKNLAALYSDGVSSNTPKELPGSDRGNKAGGGTVSQNAILGVVTQNRRSLNLCYDRVLKHDSSLKRARLPTHVKVGISGTVLSATINDAAYAQSEIGTCIAAAVKRWHFPSSDAEYETEFPIILQAE